MVSAKFRLTDSLLFIRDLDRKIVNPGGSRRTGQIAGHGIQSQSRRQTLASGKAIRRRPAGRRRRLWNTAGPVFRALEATPC